jgi:hypothetical protein
MMMIKYITLLLLRYNMIIPPLQTGRLSITHRIKIPAYHTSQTTCCGYVFCTINSRSRYTLAVRY